MVLPLRGVCIENRDGGSVKLDDLLRLSVEVIIVLDVTRRYFLLRVGLEFVVCETGKD